MFTGIVEELGEVASLDDGSISIVCARVLSDLTLGASIAVNGVCLTAVDITPEGFSADLAPETLDRSNLGDLHTGDRVNLERPLSLQARLSGHIVQGHVDGTGTLQCLRALGDGNWELSVRVPEDLDRYLVYKGSITLDGISLTIASIDSREVRVAIIPHTYEATNLAARKPGDRINIECDVLAKHIGKLLEHMTLPDLGMIEVMTKQDHLIGILRRMDRVIVAYSGGTDSAYLAWAAQQALGDNALAITADSASIPESHKRDAEAFVKQFGIRHEYVETHEFDNPDYVKNDANRCFHCKDELFTVLEKVAADRSFAHIVYGVNKDDLGDYRPGQRAATLHQVQAPLVEADLTKAEIRDLSRIAGLPTWDRPAAACLSSRIPYGTPVTIQNIKTVELGEEEIKALGFRQFRTRFHGELVRIEIAPEELQRALTLDMTRALTAIFKRLGYKYVTLDLEGYRQGSLNEVLQQAREPLLSQ